MGTESRYVGHDLLIRGGTLVDGTGSQCRQADVRVRNGVIVEVGPNLASVGELELDAAGMLVTPGFIDTHTHFDGSIFGIPRATP
jgi:N-acyl-D-amino-acid deacylase